MRTILRRASGPGAAFDFHVVLHQHSILQHRYRPSLLQFAVGIKSRRMENDIESLPLARLAARIHQWSILLVNRSRLPVVIRLIYERVENLDFIAALKNNSTIAATLAFAFNFLRRRPFN